MNLAPSTSGAPQTPAKSSVQVPKNRPDPVPFDAIIPNCLYLVKLMFPDDVNEPLPLRHLATIPDNFWAPHLNVPTAFGLWKSKYRHKLLALLFRYALL